MPNKTAVTATAALAAASILSDIRSTPKAAPAPASEVVSTTPTSSSTTPAPTLGVAAAKAGVAGAPSLTSAASSPISFSSKITADQFACDPDGHCSYAGMFTVVNNGDSPAKLNLKAGLANNRGQLLKTRIQPEEIDLKEYDGQIVSISLTPDDERCRETWRWENLAGPLSRPAPTGCAPAAGYCLIKITPQPQKAAKAPAKKKGPPGEEAAKPQIVQKQIDLGLSVPTPARLEGGLMTWSGIIALAMTLLTLIGLWGKGCLRHTMADSDLDFDKSLVANVAFTGVLLTAVGLNTVLPESTQLMGKQSYAALGFFAAVLIALAPALFKMGQRRVKVAADPAQANQPGDTEQVVGRAWVTAIASGLLLWGAVIQLGSFWFQLIEVSEARTITTESLTVFSYLLAAVVVALCFYTLVSVVTTAHREGAPAPIANGAKEMFSLTRTALPTAAKMPGSWLMP